MRQAGKCVVEGHDVERTVPWPREYLRAGRACLPRSRADSAATLAHFWPGRASPGSAASTARAMARMRAVLNMSRRLADVQERLVTSAVSCSVCPLSRRIRHARQCVQLVVDEGEKCGLWSVGLAQVGLEYLLKRHERQAPGTRFVSRSVGPAYPRQPPRVRLASLVPGLQDGGRGAQGPAGTLAVALCRRACRRRGGRLLLTLNVIPVLGLYYSRSARKALDPHRRRALRVDRRAVGGVLRRRHGTGSARRGAAFGWLARGSPGSASSPSPPCFRVQPGRVLRGRKLGPPNWPRFFYIGSACSTYSSWRSLVLCQRPVTRREGRRLFPFVGVGASLGAGWGPRRHAGSGGWLHPYTLMLLAALCS